jgi:hypothetical protein
MNHDIFQCEAIHTQYGSIRSFRHSNKERSELFSSAQPISARQSGFASDLRVEEAGCIFGAIKV